MSKQTGSNVDQQIIEAAKALGVGSYPLTQADTFDIWKEHPNAHSICMMEPENRYYVGIDYCFQKYSVSDDGFKVPQSAIMTVKQLSII